MSTHLHLRRALVWGLSAALLTTTAAPAFAQDDGGEVVFLDQADEAPDIVAARLNEEGKALVRDGKYVEALAKFRKALDLFPISNAIFNVGSMLYTLKRYEEAFPYLEQTLKAPLDPRQLEIVRQHKAVVLDKLKNSHAVMFLRSNPPNALITVNGRALPFKTPGRVLVPFGATDIELDLPGYKKKIMVIRSSIDSPPRDALVRLEREEPYAKAKITCPNGADVFIDGTMRGFNMVRIKLLTGDHTIRCGKTSKTEAFEQKIHVEKGLSNAYDLSGGPVTP
jgi:tetratricopeptide (TPR) repeat protein